MGRNLSEAARNGTGDPGHRTCPLCGYDRLDSLHGDQPRDQHDLRVGDSRFLQCPACDLVFRHRAELLGRDAERARYDTHENHPHDPAYRAFLSRLAHPLLEHLPQGAAGLDYGAGPGPALATMLEEAGHPMAIWDPFYATDRAPLAKTYDFLTCTETVEHFYTPAREFALMDTLVRPGGWLGIMTGILYPDMVFHDWWYIRDPTHVAFYAPTTLEWIAQFYGWKAHFPCKNVVLYHKALPSPERSSSTKDPS
ncbi:MAG: class I SAM-dependent methyltransferase [Gemmatimonadota bacterium]